MAQKPFGMVWHAISTIAAVGPGLNPVGSALMRYDVSGTGQPCLGRETGVPYVETSRSNEKKDTRMTQTGAAILGAFLILSLTACGPRADNGAPYAHVSAKQAEAIRREVEATLRNAYDLSKPNVVSQMLTLYPDSGHLVSASGGQVMTSRDSLATGIRDFWNNVGRNMRQPRWVWDHIYVDVLSPTAAVVTATYHVPHLTPTNQPHEIGGAMTEVFQRRGGRWVVIQEHLSDLPRMNDTIMPGM